MSLLFREEPGSPRPHGGLPNPGHHEGAFLALAAYPVHWETHLKIQVPALSQTDSIRTSGVEPGENHYPIH